MENQNTKSEAQQIQELIQDWLKHWHYFAICLAVCGILGIIYLKTATPVMNVVSRVSLRHNESLVGGGSMGKSQSLMSAFGLGRGSENIEDEASKMSSQGYIKKMIKNFDLNKLYYQKKCFGLIKIDLYDQSPIIISADSAMADTLTQNISFSLNIRPEKTQIKAKIGKQTIGKFEITAFPATVHTSWGDFTFDKSANFDSYELPLNLKIAYTNYDYIAQIYRELLKINFTKKTSDFIVLEMKTEEVPFAKKILNEIIAVYNKEYVTDKNLISDKTNRFVDERLALTENLLMAADRNIQEFKDKYNLTDIEADVTYYLKFNSELQAQILQSETQLSIINMIVDFVKDENNKYALIPYSLSIADENMSNVLSKYNEQVLLRNQQSKATMQGALARSFDENIEAQRKNLLISLDNTKKGAQVTVDNLKKKEKEFNSKIGKVPTIEKDYVNLKRDQEVQQTVYIFLLEMREETAVRGITLLPKLQVIDPPYVVNKPVSPSLMKTAMLIIFMGGILLPVSAIYIKNVIRRKKEA
ncbi:hypothetical protein AGMMS50262_14110 [Bacteroidia bacterium]|nr:hypothetical protein AGMMS50262_14110 [Bacteroidia bacterium]